jgi:hypothetical protein
MPEGSVEGFEEVFSFRKPQTVTVPFVKISLTTAFHYRNFHTLDDLLALIPNL